MKTPQPVLPYCVYCCHFYDCIIGSWDLASAIVRDGCFYCRVMEHSRVGCFFIGKDISPTPLQFNFCSIIFSLTSLLAHTLAQPTKWRFMSKNLSHLVICVINLVFTWSWVNKNHQNLIFKVNFYVKKQFYNFDFGFC